MNSTAVDLKFTRRRAMRAIVKGALAGTMGLAVLFGSPAVSSAEPKAGQNNCTKGGPVHIPSGSHCPEDLGYKETALDDPNGPGCVALCCKGDAAGKITSCVNPVSVKLDPLRNVPPMVLEPSAPVSPGGVRKLPVAPSQK